MRKFLGLTKVLLKGGGGFFTNKRGKTNWIIPAAIILGFASFAFSIMFFANVIYDGLSQANAQNILLPLVFGATSVVIFLFGIFYVISVMYHAEDVEQLRYLPLSAYQILGAKFLTLVVYEYIFESFILLPVLISFGIKSGAGVMYIIYSLLLFLITPVIALSMAAVIVIVIMRFTSFGKNKQAFKFIGGIIAIVFALGLNMLLQGSVSNISDAQLALAFQNSTLPDLFAKMFPGIGFASSALINSAGLSGLWNLLLFVLCSAGAVAVFMVIGRLFYLKGVAGITETSAKRKAIQDLGRETEGTSAVKAYIKKEIRLLFRSPTAFLQCVLSTFIWPVLIIIILFTGNEKVSMMQAIAPNIDSGLMAAIFAGLCSFITSSNSITSTTISREGKGLYFTKYIPMSMRKQLHAKAITGIIFSSISVVTTIAVIGAMMGISITVALVSLVLGLVVGAVCSYAGLLIDVNNPKLEWMNEQQAIKQNMNVIRHLLISIVFGAAAIVPVVILEMNIVLSALYILAVFTLLLVMLIKRVNGKAAETMINMDV